MVLDPLSYYKHLEDCIIILTIILYFSYRLKNKNLVTRVLEKNDLNEFYQRYQWIPDLDALLWSMLLFFVKYNKINTSLEAFH